VQLEGEVIVHALILCAMAGMSCQGSEGPKDCERVATIQRCAHAAFCLFLSSSSANMEFCPTEQNYEKGRVDKTEDGKREVNPFEWTKRG